MTRPASLHAYFGYRDAAAAINWLERVLGFETTSRYDDEATGEVGHAELRREDAAIMVFSDAGAGYERTGVRGEAEETTGHGTFLSVADEAAVDAAWERATAAGAPVLWALHTNEWGNHCFRVLDPEGFEWTVGTFQPGRPQEW